MNGNAHQLLPPLSIATSLPSFPFLHQQPPPIPPPQGMMSGVGELGFPYAPDPNISIELENGDLWRQFHRHTTEMIVNKLGRRMFPTLRFNIRGLEEKATYAIYLDLAPLDDHRYKYSGGRWTVNGRADPLPGTVKGGGGRWYMHPDGPAPGALWMRQPVSFHRIKLTNNILDPNGNVLLNSMHKYQPRLFVVRVGAYFGMPPRLEAVAAPTETQFVTVTAYQNDQVINLKVENNPFAKGFRDNGLHAEKRRIEDEPVEVKRSKPELGEEGPSHTPESTSTTSGDSPTNSATSAPSPASNHSFSALALASPAEKVTRPAGSPASVSSSPPKVLPPFSPFLPFRPPTLSAFTPVAQDPNSIALALYLDRLRSLSHLYQSLYQQQPQ